MDAVIYTREEGRELNEKQVQKSTKMTFWNVYLTKTNMSVAYA